MSKTTRGVVYRDGKAQSVVTTTRYGDGCVKTTHRKAGAGLFGGVSAGRKMGSTWFKSSRH